MATGPHVFLSSETGQPAVTADGVRVGRVVDLTVRLTTAHPVVHRVALGSGRRIRHLVPWSVVAGLDPQRLALTVGSEALDGYRVEGDPPLEDRELLLCRDVLDTQVVDLAGQRMSRVSDVLVVHRPDGTLEIAAVDVGLGSLLRRMGLGRIGARLAPVAVDWEDLHLTSSRGHVVQLSTDTTGFRKLDAQGLAELLARLSTGKATDVIRTVGPARSAEALRASHPVHGRRLLRSLGRAGAQEVVDAAPTSDAGDLAALRPPDDVPRRRLLRSSGWRRHRPPRRVPRTPPESSR